MKDKVLTFIIGALVGAIITTGVFLFINKNNSSKGQNRIMRGGLGQGQMQGDFIPGEMPSGEKMKNGHSGKQNKNSTNSAGTSNEEAPEPPQGSESQQPPELPQSSNAQTTSNS